VKDGVKVVTSEWLAKLDAFALAIWYQDDGSWYRRRSRGRNGKTYEHVHVQLHTDGFDQDSVQLLSSFLLQKFGVKNRLRKRTYKNGMKQEYWSIVVQDRRKFWGIVAPWSTLRYKFNWDVPEAWFDHGSFGAELEKVMNEYDFSGRERFSHRRYPDGDRCVAQIARDHGLNEDTVRHRLDAGEELTAALKPVKPPRTIRFNGEERTVREWAKKLGMKPVTLHVRIGRWGVERALTAPIRKCDARECTD